MNIIDINKSALVAWGTKRGKQVFFSENIQAKKEEINNLLQDIQTPVGISSMNQLFYSFEYIENVISFTIYRSIYDWLGRKAFYAISVFANKEAKVPLSHMPEILNDLSKLYYDKYIATSSKRYQIGANTIENKKLFVDLLEERTKNKTDSIINIKSTLKNKKFYTKYKDNEELINIFENIGRQELENVKQLILMPIDIKGITCAYPTIKLEPIVKNNTEVPFVIKIKDNKKEVIHKIQINVVYNGKKEIIDVRYGKYNLENNIAIDNSVIIEIESENYKYFKKIFNVREIYNRQSKQAIAEIVLEKKKTNIKSKITNNNNDLYISGKANHYKQKKDTLNEELKLCIKSVSNDGRLTKKEKEVLREKAEDNKFPYQALLQLAEEATEKRRIEIESNKPKTEIESNKRKTEIEDTNTIKISIKYKDKVLKQSKEKIYFRTDTRNEPIDIDNNRIAEIKNIKEEEFWIETNDKISNKYKVKEIAKQDCSEIVIKDKKTDIPVKNDDKKKKENFFKKHTEIVIAVSVSIIVIAIIVIAIMFRKPKNNYYNEALNVRYIEIKQTVAGAKSYNICKTKYYAALDSFKNIKTEVDSLIKAKILKPDDIKLSDDYISKVKALYKNELSKEINKHVQSINFDLKKTEELIKEVKLNDLDTTNLVVFKKICVQVKKADGVFRTKGKYKGKIRPIEKELEKFKTAGILKNQKKEIDFYFRVLQAVRTSGYGSFKNFLVWQKKRVPGEAKEINDFLKRKKYIK